MSDNRELFEETMGRELSLARRDHYTYISNTTQIAWESWKAAWNAATKRAAGVCTSVKNTCNSEDEFKLVIRCQDEILKGLTG